jgi:hypothetical protein
MMSGIADRGLGAHNIAAWGAGHFAECGPNGEYRLLRKRLDMGTNSNGAKLDADRANGVELFSQRERWNCGTTPASNATVAWRSPR